MEDNHPLTALEESQTEFPPKPVFQKTESSFNFKPLISLLLFIGAFYFFFDRDLEFILLVVGALFIHELGHYLAMKYFGYKELKIFFIPLLGAAATGTKREVSQKEMAIILLAGPIPGIVLGATGYFWWLNGGPVDVLEIGGLFILLNVFNLIPFKPLDGGRLMEVLFLQAQGILQQVFAIVSAIGIGAVALYSETYFLLVVPYFLWLELSFNAKRKRLKYALKQKELDFTKEFEELSDREYWLTRDEILRHLPVSKTLQVGVYPPDSNENAVIQQIQALSSPTPIQDVGFAGKALFFFVWFIGLAAPIAGIVHFYL